MAQAPEHEEETVTEHDDAVRTLVSSMLSGSCSEETYLREVSTLCRAKSHAAYRLLSQIERYRRLGRMPTIQYRVVRARIEEALQARKGLSAHRPPPISAAVPPAQREPSPAEIGSDDAVTRDLIEQPLSSVRRERPVEPVAPTLRPARESMAPAAPESPTTAAANAAPPASEDIQPGTVLRGRYELLSLLGRGGMGSVYKARDRYRASLGLEDCHVAVKIARPRLPSSAHGHSLGREFHNAQKLSHPNVINVYEIDQDGAIPYYTMELLEGERLSQVLKQVKAPLARRHALAIIREVGAAIVHAHARGVVHGDLKPHNVMITQRGEVRVLDFGGVSAEWQGPSPGPWISDPSSSDSFRPATPAYASCEQLEGRRADRRDDLYALACMTYQLLSGRHPFDRANALEARASRMRVRRPPGLRPEAWRALRRALAFRRELRAMPLEGWLRQIGVGAAAAQLPALEQLSEPARRRAEPWPQRLAAGMVLCLALALVAYALHGFAPGAWQTALAATRHTLNEAWLGLHVPASASEAPAPENPAIAAPVPAASNPAAATPAAAPLAIPAASAAAPITATRERPRGTDAALPAAPPGVTFAASTYRVPDKDPAARIVVRRLAGTRGDVSFVWWTEAASAKPDVDYAPLGRRTEHIPNGAEQVTVYVPIISNPLREQPTQFYVALAPANSDDPTLARERATVTIERGG